MIGIIVLLIILLFSRNINRDWINPISIFAAVWFVSWGLYLSGLLAYNQVTSLTYIVIVVGVLLFAFGASFGKRIKTSDNEGIQYQLTYKIVIILEIVSILVMLPDAINSIVLLRSGLTFNAIRTNAILGTTVVSNPVISLIRNYIVNPFIILVYPLASYTLFFCDEKKKKVAIMTLAVIICACDVFYHGGRSCILYFLLHLILVPRLFGNRIYISKAVKRRIILGIIVAVAIFYIVSISRGIDDFQKSIVLYVSGCIPLMDNYITGISQTGQYLYGGAFFEGILRLVFTLLDNIGISYPAFVSVIESATNFEQTIAIGNDLRMNAFVSCFTYFFYDGGIFAVIIESFLYGAFSGVAYKNAVLKKDSRSIITYAVIIQSLVFAIVRFQFILPSFIIAIIMVRLLFRSEFIDNE